MSEIQLFDGNTFQSIQIPDSIKLYNYMSAIQSQQNEQIVYLTGGINLQKDYISNQFLLYNKQQNAFQTLPSFKAKRYSHQSIIHDQKLYIMGGIGSNNQILTNCEIFDFKTNQWNEIGNLNDPRSTFFTFIYKERVHVCGGYSGNKIRSEIIEAYNQEKDQWEVKEYKLNLGIECGSLLVFPKTNDSICIFGGNTKFGGSQDVLMYNLQEKTIQLVTKMQKKRILQKMFLTKNNIYVFGGDSDNQFTIEKAIYEQTDQQKQLDFQLQYTPIQQSYKEYSFIQKTQIVPHIPQANRIINNFRLQDMIYFFIPYKNPSIYELSIEEQKGIFNKPVPENFHIYQHANGVKIPDLNALFICGGIQDEIKGSTYIYYPEQNIVEVQQNMLKPRYAFGCIQIDQFIYVIGGRIYGNDNEAILSECERFNLQEKKWEHINPLNYKRCSCTPFIIQNNLYVTGGYTGEEKREFRFEYYNQNCNCWELMAVELPQGIEGGFSMYFQQSELEKLIFFGGRNEEGDSDQIFLYDISYGFDSFKYHFCGKMGSKRSMHKVFCIKKEGNLAEIIVFGGISNGKYIEMIQIDFEKDKAYGNFRKECKLLSEIDYFLQLQNQSLQKMLIL